MIIILYTISSTGDMEVDATGFYPAFSREDIGLHQASTLPEPDLPEEKQLTDDVRPTATLYLQCSLYRIGMIPQVWQLRWRAQSRNWEARASFFSVEESQENPCTQVARILAALG